MYLIVDDFMSSGATYDAIREAVEKEHPHAECLGMLEVAYAANDGEKTYRKSHNNKDELERRQRMVEGKAIASDIEWATREKPRVNWPMSRFFYNPYDQKQQQQTSPEATGSAATEG